MLLLLSLFVASFLAATLLPFSSEVVLVGAIEGGAKANEAFFVASFGNVLAIVLNYYLGYFLYEKTKAKLFRSKNGTRVYGFASRYGYFSLILSWLPVFGDPLTLVAGMLRLHFGVFLIVAGGLRIFRYYLVVAAL